MICGFLLVAVFYIGRAGRSLREPEHDAPWPVAALGPRRLVGIVLLSLIGTLIYRLAPLIVLALLVPGTWRVFRVRS